MGIVLPFKPKEVVAKEAPEALDFVRLQSGGVGLVLGRMNLLGLVCPLDTKKTKVLPIQGCTKISVSEVRHGFVGLRTTGRHGQPFSGWEVVEERIVGDSVRVTLRGTGGEYSLPLPVEILQFCYFE